MERHYKAVKNKWIGFAEPDRWSRHSM